MIASTLANVHRDPQHKSDPYEPSDFFPSLKIDKREARQMTAQETEDYLTGFARALGAEVECETK